MCDTALNYCSWKFAANQDTDQAGCSQEPRETLTCGTGRLWWRYRAVCGHSRGSSSQCPISSSSQGQMPSAGFKVRHCLLGLTQVSCSFGGSCWERRAGLSWNFPHSHGSIPDFPKCYNTPSPTAHTPCSLLWESLPSTAILPGIPSQSCNSTDTLQTCSDYASCYSPSFTLLKRH